MTLEESGSFAVLSGDFNTQHLDAVRARRLLFGAPVIHGVHLVLLGLDATLTAFARRTALQAIRVVFSAPASTGSSLSFVVEESSDGTITTLIKFDGRTIVTVDASWSEDAFAAERARIPDERFAVAKPLARSIENVKGLRGQIPLKVDRPLLRQLFPNVAVNLPVDQIAILLATTRIVGMECPGANSIFAAFDIEFTLPGGDAPPLLNFEVTQTRPSLKFCSMTIAGAGAKGHINAMFRPPVFEQPGMREVQAKVPRDSFTGQRVLIVGGSRGLGELSAKIVAAGGGETAITYARGGDDAARVASDIRNNGGSASVFHWDVMRGGEAIPPWWNSSSITHLYYFASPRIEPNRSGAFDQKSFALYCRYYVSGLEFLLSRFLPGRKFPLTLFNPSTIYIDQPDATFAEYASAKAESEKLCTDMQRAKPDALRVVMPRLPRLRTDQTTTLRGEDVPGALSTLLSTLPAGA